MEKLNKNNEPKILVSKVQHILEWTKTKIYTVSKARLGNYITKLSKDDISNIDNSLYVSLGLMKNIKKYEEKIENLNKYIEKLKSS